MTTVYLCRGSDCRKQKLPRKALARFVGDLPIVVVGCQKVCKAPVVGIDVGKGPRWYRRMHSSRALEGLRSLIATGKAPDVLKAREAGKRAGKLRG